MSVKEPSLRKYAEQKGIEIRDVFKFPESAFKNKILIHEPERAEGIKNMFKFYPTNDYSGTEVAKILRTDGLTIKSTAGNEPRLIAKGNGIRLLNKRAYTREFV